MRKVPAVQAVVVTPVPAPFTAHELPKGHVRQAASPLKEYWLFEGKQ